MCYDLLDNEELLRLSVTALNNSRDTEAVVMLKTLLEREPDSAHARYLLAAQQMQIGLIERAEEGLREVVSAGSELDIARFQLGQLLIMKGEVDEAGQVLEALLNSPGALGSYANALLAASKGDMKDAISHLGRGLSLLQENTVLAADMQRLREQWEQGLVTTETVQSPRTPPSMFLSGYGRNG